MEIKERIIQGGEELFFKYGIKSITMDTIASHLGISKKTIYEHVGDKNNLVELVSEAHFYKEQNILEEIEKNSINAIDEIFNVSIHMKQNFSKINPSLFFDIKRYHAKVWNMFDEKKHECIGGTLIRNLERGIREGFYRKEINPIILAKLRMKQVEWGFDGDEFPITEFSFVDVQMQLFEHFLYGIATEKGITLFIEYKKQDETN